MARFCCGVTRPKTCESLTTRSKSASGILRASTGAPESMPSERVTAPTESALSPEMTFTSTPWLRKYSSVPAASGRIFCSRTTRATGSTAPGAPSAVTSTPARPSSSTRRPVEAISWARSPAAAAAWEEPDEARTSGAPSTQSPPSAKLMPDHFFADVKGWRAVTVHGRSARPTPSTIAAMEEFGASSAAPS